MSNIKYWIVVASKDHITRGIAGSFIQANHGKEAPLKRMHQHDKVICYSPKITMLADDKCQAFTAIGTISGDTIYQHAMSENFVPYRREVEFMKCGEIPILPLIDELDLIVNKKSWGYSFRFGLLEISEHDYKLISEKMIPDEGGR